ncbi:MAG: DNA primase [Spirochaetales bacterium]|nr:DNA primase [Spirochaetales bacterium]
MAIYSEAVLESIKSRLTMSEVVSPYVRLTRKGDRYWGLCPFHNDKNPSFTVVDNAGANGGFYKCFACGKGGGLFNFIMDIEHVDFPEAVEILAKKANVELREESEQEKKELDRKKAIGILYDKLAKYLHQYLLKSSTAEKARSYITKRGITDDTCEKFLLGYVPPQQGWMHSMLSKQDYSDDILSASGLFAKDNLDKAFFRDRIMFPIRNWQGNCVAFSGRDMSGFADAPKYKNSPETSLYSKRNVLFGFYESIPAMKEKKQVIICEGNFDVISLHQAGLDYSCATCGTALTPEHIKLIKRYCDRIYLLFDSDVAGQKATKAALLLAQKNELSNFVMSLEGAKDASQMLEEQGAQALQRSCVNSTPGFSYLVSSALKLYDIRQPKGKSSVFKEVKPYLDATSSDIERQGYIKYLSNVLRVSEDQVMSDYLRQRGDDIQPEESVPEAKTAFNPLKTSTELNAMLILLKNRNRFSQFRNQVKLNHLSDPAAIKLYTVLEDASRQEVRTDDMVLQMIGDSELKDLAVTAFTSKMYERMDVDKTLDDAVFQIRLAQLEQRRANIQRMLNGGEIDISDEQEFSNLLQIKMALDREIEELKGDREVKE